MNKAISKSRLPQPALQSGQIWRMDGSHVQIGVVGKRLVHYKHFKGEAKRTSNSLSAIPVLEKFLRSKKAVLVQT